MGMSVVGNVGVVEGFTMRRIAQPGIVVFVGEQDTRRVIAREGVGND
jgi:hypothetical protein